MSERRQPDRARLAAWAAALPPGPWRWVPADRCGWDDPAAGPSGMALVAADGTWVWWADSPAGGVSLDGSGPYTAAGAAPAVAEALAALPALPDGSRTGEAPDPSSRRRP